MKGGMDLFQLLQGAGGGVNAVQPGCHHTGAVPLPESLGCKVQAGGQVDWGGRTKGEPV